MTTTTALQAQYRKKPVVIEAYQYRAGEQDGRVAADVVAGRVRYTEAGTMLIQTLEGVMEASPGDWIIRGVKGELYPCKPDIFAATYEPAALSAAQDAPAVQVEDCTVYVLNSLGTNRWWATVQGGHDDKGHRIDDDERRQIAQVIAARASQPTPAQDAAATVPASVLSAATALVRWHLDGADVHPCDQGNDDVRARACIAEVGALYDALKATPPAPQAAPTAAQPTDGQARSEWPWCIDSGAPIEGGHPAMRPEMQESGLYRCWTCGRDIAACHTGGGGQLRLARHKRGAPTAQAPALVPLTPDEVRWAVREAKNQNGPSDAVSLEQVAAAGIQAFCAKNGITAGTTPKEQQ